MKDEIAELTTALMAGDSAVKDQKSSQAQILINLANAVHFFHCPSDDAYADVFVGDRVETWPVRGKDFKRWLISEFYKSQGKPPHTQALQDAISVLEARAHFDSPEYRLYLRVAEHAGKIFVDLCDEQRRVVEIDTEGWRIVRQPPVHFRRTKGMRPLVAPLPGGSIHQLRRFLNIGSDTNWLLCLAWILAAYRARGPYLILILQGEQGSAKSTTAKLLRRLIDPSMSPVRTISKDERDMMIASSNSHVIAYDNLSRVLPWLSDALCRLATGGGFSTRELYSNSDEAIFDAMRPVILNGIDHLAERPDLAERALILNLPAIAESDRRDEAELYAEFERELPQIIGALFTGMSGALARLPHVKLARKPRMADFSLWATAAEEPLGFDAGDFMRAYAGNRADAVEETLYLDPVSSGILSLMENRVENGESERWTGTSAELLRLLATRADDGTMASPSWPKSPQVLSSRLRRIAPFMRESGVHITPPTKSGRGRRLLTIEKKTISKVPLASERSQNLGGAESALIGLASGDVAGVVAIPIERETSSPRERFSSKTLDPNEKKVGSTEVARVATKSAPGSNTQNTDECPRCGRVHWQRLGGVLVCSKCGQEAPGPKSGERTSAAGI